MRPVLLDSHILVWTQQNSTRLGKKARNKLLDEEVDLWISPVTSLEISRLVAGQRLELAKPVQAWLETAILSLRLNTAPISHAIAIEAYQIPEPFHPDPADRLLVATCRLQDFTLMTADERILSYRFVNSVDGSR